MITLKEENNTLLVYQDDILIATDKDVGIFISRERDAFRATTKHLIEHMNFWAEANVDKAIITGIPKKR